MSITQKQLIDGLYAIHDKQRAFVTVEVECSDNKISKKCPFHNDVKKISTISGRIPIKSAPGETYERAVNRQRDREGIAEEFTALPANYEWFEGPLVKYKNDGELGLPLIVGSHSSVWRRASTGEELTPEEIAQWTLKKTYKKPERQGLEKPVTWNVPKIKNIRKITADSLELEVSPAST